MIGARDDTARHNRQGGCNALCSSCGDREYRQVYASAACAAMWQTSRHKAGELGVTSSAAAMSGGWHISARCTGG